MDPKSSKGQQPLLSMCTGQYFVPACGRCSRGGGTGVDDYRAVGRKIKVVRPFSGGKAIQWW